MKNTKKWKTILGMVGFIAITAMIGFSMAACEEPHACSFGDWEIDIPATCIEAAVEKSVCSCGNSQTRTSTTSLATGHQGLNALVPATCTTPGTTANGTCSACDTVVTSTTIPATGHQGLTPRVEATCTVDGLTANGTCTTCETVVTGTVLPAAHQGTWTVTNSYNGMYPAESSGTCTVCTQTITRNTEIGDVGPGGGVVFYINETSFWVGAVSGSDTGRFCNYLESAMNNLNNNVRVAWANNNADIPGTTSAIGAGKENTRLILEADPTAPAALLCKEYDGGGKNDWYLPSQNELIQLTTRRSIVGGFASFTNIWSSSQMNTVGFTDSASVVQLTTNSINSGSSFTKDSIAYVRAIRAF